MENNDIIENEHLNQPFLDFALEDNRTGVRKVLDAYSDNRGQPDAERFHSDIGDIIISGITDSMLLFIQADQIDEILQDPNHLTESRVLAIKERIADQILLSMARFGEGIKE